MRRVCIVASIVISAATAAASDNVFRLSGWAEIPSSYRHPGPAWGQLAAGANGVTPPYAGQPIPGFSGIIPSSVRGRFIGLPDNGVGAQTNSADFVIGFYKVTPDFKATGDGTTSRGPVNVDSFTPFSDPHGYLNAEYITGGPVYNRSNLQRCRNGPGQGESRERRRAAVNSHSHGPDANGNAVPRCAPDVGMKKKPLFLNAVNVERITPPSRSSIQTR